MLKLAVELPEYCWYSKKWWFVLKFLGVLRLASPSVCDHFHCKCWMQSKLSLTSRSQINILLLENIDEDSIQVKM